VYDAQIKALVGVISWDIGSLAGLRLIFLGSSLYLEPMGLCQVNDFCNVHSSLRQCVELHAQLLTYFESGVNGIQIYTA
jgi:hypothetical protein